jgi:Zn-dependent protease
MWREHFVIGRGRLASNASRLLCGRIQVGSFFGTPVSVHWTWLPCLLLVATWNARWYSQGCWAIAEFLGVFAAVLVHEFGHVIAARRLGVLTAEVILWPLGGLAAMTIRPGTRGTVAIAAAGPLVNLVLVPVTFWLWWQFGYYRGGDVSRMLWGLAWANVNLVVFNLLPVWPLDGGRVAQAWVQHYMGQSRGGLVSGVVSIGCASLGIAWAVHVGAVVAVAFLSALVALGVQLVRQSLRLLAAERRWGVHETARCPSCRQAAIDAPYASCDECGERCNYLHHDGRCWNCGTAGKSVRCYYCGEPADATNWMEVPPAAPTSALRPAT